MRRAPVVIAERHSPGSNADSSSNCVGLDGALNVSEVSLAVKGQGWELGVVLIDADE